MKNAFKSYLKTFLLGFQAEVLVIWLDLISKSLICSLFLLLQLLLVFNLYTGNRCQSILFPRWQEALVGQMLIVLAAHAPPILFSSLLAELKTN